MKNKSVISRHFAIYLLSCVQLFVTLWTVVLQAPLTRNSPGKNIGVGCYSLLQGNLPDPEVELAFPAL